jgi:hypothetical protein
VNKKDWEFDGEVFMQNIEDLGDCLSGEVRDPETSYDLYNMSD